MKNFIAYGIALILIVGACGNATAQGSKTDMLRHALCKVWKSSLLTVDGKTDPERNIKGKVRFELRSDSTFNLQDATEGTLEKVDGTWDLTADSLIILSVPMDGELTRFKVREISNNSLVTQILEDTEHEDLVTFIAE